MSLPDDISREEQCRDILNIVNDLLPYFLNYDLDTGTAAGRTKSELLLLKQEIEADRFPLPASKGKVATINYHAHNKYLPEEIPDLTLKLRDIVSLVECEGIVKKRHFPRLIELCVSGVSVASEIMEKEKGLLKEETNSLKKLQSEYKNLAQRINRNSVTFPVDDYAEVYPNITYTKLRLEIKRRYPLLQKANADVHGAMTSNWRPRQSQPSGGWVMPDWVK